MTTVHVTDALDGMYHRVEPGPHGKTAFHKDLLQDPRLSPSARGLLCGILTYEQPPTVEYLETRTPDPSEVRPALAELEARGWIVLA